MVLRFYRSPFMRCMFGLGGLIGGLVLIFGDGQKWRATPSFRYVTSIGGALPHPQLWVLQAWGAVLVVYGLMLLANFRRDIAYIIGMCVYIYFAAGLILTLNLNTPAPRNIVAILGMLDAIAAHWASARLAQAERKGLLPPASGPS